MGGRYFITGVQLGMLKTFSEHSFRDEEKRDILEIINSIINNQYIGTKEDLPNIKYHSQKIWTSEEIDRFLSRILKILIPLIEESIGD